MVSHDPPSARYQLLAAIGEAIRKHAARRRPDPPTSIAIPADERIDCIEARRALAVLMQLPANESSFAQLDATYAEIVADAEQQADRVAEHLNYLADHFESIKCLTVDEIQEYLIEADQVLEKLYRESGRPMPSPTKLKRLALQYALDARKPVEGSIDRFDLKRLDSGYEVAEYPSAAMRIPAIPMPGRKVQNVFAIAILDAVHQNPPQLYRLRELVEQLLDECSTDELPRHSNDRRSRSRDNFVVSLEHSTVVTGGKTFVVDLAHVNFLHALATADGMWVTSAEMVEQAELVGQRPDRILRKLPPPIRSLIQSQGGKGYRLRTEALE